MKKFMLFFSLMLAFALCITSCAKENQDGLEGSEQEYYTVQLGFGGEWEVYYEPLTRAQGNNDIYGIQVYSCPENAVVEGDYVEWAPYAYGIFDDVDNITISLLKGYKYKFVATMVVDGKDKLFMNTSVNGYDGLADPFYGLLGPTALDNKFYYSVAWCMYGLGNGSTLMSDFRVYNRPNADRYYGEEQDYVPGSKGEKVKIKMKRASFGAKFIAKGKMANSGQMEVKILGAPDILFDLSDSNQYSDTYTFENVYLAWREGGNYSETVKVMINWLRSDGSVLPLGSHDIVYKRNATTVVKVEVQNEGEASQLGVELVESGLMPEDAETETTIVDGEVVDTDVSTNK